MKSTLYLAVLIFILFFWVPASVVWYVGFEITFVSNMFERGKDFADALS